MLKIHMFDGSVPILMVKSLELSPFSLLRSQGAPCAALQRALGTPAAAPNCQRSLDPSLRRERDGRPNRPGLDIQWIGELMHSIKFSNIVCDKYL
jgi:hypothetical protein